MKYLLAVLTIAFLGFSRDALAQITHYDSVSLNSPLIFASGVTDTSFLFGNPDGSSAHFGNGGEIADRFRVGSTVVPMQKGDTIHVFWNIPSIAPADSNVGRIHLQRLSDDFKLTGEATYDIVEPRTINTEEMATIIVPDTGYNAIAVEMASDTGGNSFWLDAITMRQSGVAAVNAPSALSGAILTSYPNPIEHGSRAMVHIVSPEAGKGELVIYDALGQEVERVPVGELSSGSAEDVPVLLDRSGIFIARLYVDGAPAENVLKLIAE